MSVDHQTERGGRDEYMHFFVFNYLFRWTRVVVVVDISVCDTVYSAIHSGTAIENAKTSSVVCRPLWRSAGQRTIQLHYSARPFVCGAPFAPHPENKIVTIYDHIATLTM